MCAYIQVSIVMEHTTVLRSSISLLACLSSSMRDAFSGDKKNSKRWSSTVPWLDIAAMAVEYEQLTRIAAAGVCFSASHSAQAESVKGNSFQTKHPQTINLLLLQAQTDFCLFSVYSYLRNIISTGPRSWLPAAVRGCLLANLISC